MEEKNKMKNKLAQEEIVGFALIIIIMAVIILFFLVFYLKEERESVESYEANSFIQAFLHYTTECENYREYLSIQKLIFECEKDFVCLNERNSCEVLNSTLKGIVEESWKTGGDRPVKGYEMNITSGQKELIYFKEGEISASYQGAKQDFLSSGINVEILFRAYS